jgi:hypothetical protein
VTGWSSAETGAGAPVSGVAAGALGGRDFRLDGEVASAAAGVPESGGVGAAASVSFGARGRDLVRADFFGASGAAGVGAVDLRVGADDVEAFFGVAFRGVLAAVFAAVFAGVLRAAFSGAPDVLVFAGSALRPADFRAAVFAPDLAVARFRALSPFVVVFRAAFGLGRVLAPDLRADGFPAAVAGFFEATFLEATFLDATFFAATFFFGAAFFETVFFEAAFFAAGLRPALPASDPAPALPAADFRVGFFTVLLEPGRPGPPADVVLLVEVAFRLLLTAFFGVAVPFPAGFAERLAAGREPPFPADFVPAPRAAFFAAGAFFRPAAGLPAFFVATPFAAERLPAELPAAVLRLADPPAVRSAAFAPAPALRAAFFAVPPGFPFPDRAAEEAVPDFFAARRDPCLAAIAGRASTTRGVVPGPPAPRVPDPLGSVGSSAVVHERVMSAAILTSSGAGRGSGRRRMCRNPLRHCDDAGWRNGTARFGLPCCAPGRVPHKCRTGVSGRRL